MVAIEGDPAASGVMVEIASVEPGKSAGRIAPVELSAGNNFRAHFFLQAGYYTVRALRSDQPEFRQSFNLPEYRKLTVSLAGRFPSTAPAARSDISE
jgi:hypothetical protein